MRQHISANQLQELNPEQQDKLREWWSIHQQQGDVFICLGNDFLSGKVFAWDGHNKPFKLAVPLLSVGQCIELLDPKEEAIFTMMKYIASEPQIYEVNVGGTEYYGDSMCDCLWQAVKEVALHIETKEEKVNKAREERLSYIRHCEKCFKVFSLKDYDFSGGLKCPHCGSEF